MRATILKQALSATITRLSSAAARLGLFTFSGTPITRFDGEQIRRF